MKAANKFSAYIFTTWIKKMVWENTLNKQGRAIAPPHLKNSSKNTKTLNYMSYEKQA